MADQRTWPDDEKVLFRGQFKPFGDFTAADAREQADDLANSTDYLERKREGLTDPPASDVVAWRELADELERVGVTYVRELPEHERIAYARRLGIGPSST